MIVRREHMPVRVHGHLQGGMPDKGLHRFRWQAALDSKSLTQHTRLQIDNEEVLMEANKKIALRALTGAFVDRDPSVVEQFASDYIQHNPTIPSGPAAI